MKTEAVTEIEGMNFLVVLTFLCLVSFQVRQWVIHSVPFIAIRWPESISAVVQYHICLRNPMSHILALSTSSFVQFVRLCESVSASSTVVTIFRN